MLKGELTGLRAIETADLSTLLFWRNNPAFRRYFREYRELSMFDQEHWFNSKVIGDPCTKMFSVVDLKTGDLIGACGLCYIDFINRSADFSIYIGFNNLYIDDVLAVDAGRTLIKYGFEELNLHRIWSEIYDFDNKKIDLFATLGFELNGRHKQTHWTEGKWCDSLFYGLINE